MVKWDRLSWRGNELRLSREQHLSEDEESERVEMDFGDDAGGDDLRCAGLWDFGRRGVGAGESGAAEAAGA